MNTIALPTRKTGFTIVELLIVIVVIGILAAITVVAYGNISNRATNSSVMSAVNQVIKLTQGYITSETTYPHTGRTCSLESACYYGGLVGVNATYRTNISKIGTLPGGVPTWSGTYGGVLYDYSAARTYNGNANPAVVMYFLKGANQDCGREVANTLSDTIVTSSNPYTQVIGTTTMCVTPLRGPTS